MKLHGLVPNFHIHVSVSNSCIPTIDRSSYFLYQNRRTDRSWEYINCTGKKKYGNSERGRGVSFLGIFVANFQYSVYACQVFTKSCTGKDYANWIVRDMIQPELADQEPINT